MTARVLVVDDVEANRKLLQAKLGHEYFEVDTARDGHEALRMVRERDYDIILLDVMMPGLDGFEVCERLKSDPLTAHIPVVMVTAMSEREERLRGLKAGAEDFITKPIDDFALMSRMRALMRYNHVVSELRQREANGRRVGLLDVIRQDDFDRALRIFIIDDNARRATNLKSMLSSRHHCVTFQEAGGIAANDAKPFELILLSLSIRAFDPLRVCATLLNNEATRSCSIIAISDFGEEKKAVKALDLGASDIITAPVDAEELMARVRTQGRRARYLDILRRRVDLGLELAVRDQLTGLNNRRFMSNQLVQRMRRVGHGGKSLSVIVLDLDHFKRVNDCFGHAAGDEVLREVAGRIQLNVRPSDIPCRYGGEEFVIILPETEGDVACSIAERIRSAVAAQPFALPDGETLAVTVSLGVGTSNAMQDTPADLLERADKALYQAKAAGRNQVQAVAA